MDVPANAALLALIADSEMHARALLDYEVASALRAPARGRKLTGRRRFDAVEDFNGLRIERYPLAGMMPAVLRLRENFSVYDAAYIVLTQALDAPLVTADDKLAKARRLRCDVRVLRPEG